MARPSTSHPSARPKPPTPAPPQRTPSDAGTIVSVSADQTVRLWTVASGAMQTLKGKFSSGYGVAVTPDGQRIVGGFWGGFVRVWGLASQQLLAVFEGHRDIVRGVAISPDGRCVCLWAGGGGGQGRRQRCCTRGPQRAGGGGLRAGLL